MYYDYGSWNTIDQPTKNADKAFEWLSREFEKINGYVYRKTNAHDFGRYVSFEVDIPEEIKEIDEDNEETSDEQVIKKDDWIKKANKIEVAYHKKFERWL